MLRDLTRGLATGLACLLAGAPAVACAAPAPSAGATSNTPSVGATPNTPSVGATPNTPSVGATPNTPSAGATPNTPVARTPPPTSAPAAQPHSQTSPPAAADAFAIGGLKLAMTPAEVETALRGRDIESQIIRRPAADGRNMFVAALVVRSKAVRPRPQAHAAEDRGHDNQHANQKPADTAVAPPVEQIAVIFSQFNGNRATEILRLRRYGANELVGDAKLREALRASYGLDLPPLGPPGSDGADAGDTITATRAVPQRSAEPPTVAVSKTVALSAAAPDAQPPGHDPAIHDPANHDTTEHKASTRDASSAPATTPPATTPPAAAPSPGAPSPGAPPPAAPAADKPAPKDAPKDAPATPAVAPVAAPGTKAANVKLPACTTIADHAGFDMAMLASDPGLAPMPLWTGFIPGCGVTLSVSAHRATSDSNAYDAISQHLIDQSAALADLEALRDARTLAAAAGAKARQEAAAGHAPSL